MSYANTRHLSTPAAALVTTLLMVAGCNSEPGEVATAESEPAQEQTRAAPTPNTGPVFDASVSEDKCSLLTPTQVAAAASVPEAAVEQNPSLCLYEWENANIYLSSVRVHDSIEDASRHYARNTEDFPSGEMRDAKEQLKDEMEASGAGSPVSGALIDAAPEGLPSHERWDDIGSQAAWDGNTTVVRYGNVTVKFSGKTYDRPEGEDWVPRDLSRAIARTIVANLDAAREYLGSE